MWPERADKQDCEDAAGGSHTRRLLGINRGVYISLQSHPTLSMPPYHQILCTHRLWGPGLIVWTVSQLLCLTNVVLLSHATVLLLVL